ncbi:hypothetical protein [Streptomyces aidingensis]|uniref:hypothetical protein n=1 Tax=Streptomyces aidingensis TaxID=910347 RepID=UPI00111499A9|nr:hypothetical protein [Streptomyces aidingensis]
MTRWHWVGKLPAATDNRHQDAAKRYSEDNPSIPHNTLTSPDALPPGRCKNRPTSQPRRRSQLRLYSRGSALEGLQRAASMLGLVLADDM